MGTVTETELAATLETLQGQMAEITKRLLALEQRAPGANGAGAAAARAPQLVPAPAGITEEELLAISAAIGAYLGVRAHIRQIRLVSTSAWAQQGRVSIQASHRL
jgi:methylmalonyl-CoA carboxyltransferase large subunit